MNIIKSEINNLKNEVKKLTGRKIKDIEGIKAFGKDFIDFEYYKTNYDRATNNLTVERIGRV